MLRDLVGIFRIDLPRYLNVLEKAVKEMDARQVAQAAHALKGMLANLSAARAAAHLEALSRESKTAEFAEALAAFKEEVSGVLPELEEVVAEEKT